MLTILKKVKKSESLIVILYMLSVVLSIAAILHFSSLFFHYDLSEIGSGRFLLAVSLLICFCLLSFNFGWRIYKKDSVGFYMTTISMILTITIPVGIMELVLRKTTPSWPAIALHGVAPDIGKEAWGRIQSLNSMAIGNNSWGQRDNERTVDTPPGKIRIAFIGDSFLEESSIIPVSLLVEESLPSLFEVISLGVSATNPIDYYWRLKNVALKLDVKHVFVFMYMGNDLLENKPVDNRSITSTLFSPPPKSSLLGTLTPSINYHLSKKYKRSTNVWLDDNLHGREQSILGQLRKINVDKLPRFLALNYPLRGRKECFDNLSSLDLHDFYQMLTNPDMGLFRTYIIVDAIGKFCRSYVNPPTKTGSYSLRMINLMRELSQNNGVGFSVVIVPQGFDVDDRMWSQWKILSDFREQYNHSLNASNFKNSLLDDSLDIVDLYPVFESTQGTYLNVDGHWSKLGNELAATKIVQHIMNLNID